MRYSRIEKLKEIPNDFVSLIKDKKIVVVGCGGVGSVLCEQLVRSGFLNLVLVDNDLIDETNLSRQNFSEDQLGENKAKALKDNLLKIDKNGDFLVFFELLDAKNVQKVLKSSDLVIDCSDNFEVRKIINDYCVKEKIDWIYSGAVKTEFASCVFYHDKNYFSKVFGKNPKNESCCDVGVLASSTFGAASLVYNNVIKYFSGVREDKLVKIDLWKGNLFEVNLK